MSVIDHFARTTEDILSLESFKKLLDSGKKLRLKYGVDVTAPTLHIGHAVNLWMLRYLQDLGHTVIFLIGDFTTTIGDPTGKNKTRPQISHEEIEENVEKFIEQANMVLRFDDPELLEIRRNSEWFGTMPTAEFLKLLSMLTHARLISRDMFQKRIEEGNEIHMHELLYPVLQGYDSVMLESDLTIIGSDQLFNEMLGRTYQEKFGQEPQVIITTRITPGIDGGPKQSKSLGNYIGLAHSPRDKYGRVMSIPDDQIVQYLEVYTDVPMDEIRQIQETIDEKPMEHKKFLAFKIVERYHGKSVAEEEAEWFDKTISKKQVPDEIPEVEISDGMTLFDVLVAHFGSTKSKSQIRRLFAQGAIKCNDNKVTDCNTVVTDNDIIKAGKRVWLKTKKSNS